MERVKGRCASQIAVQEQSGHQAAKVGIIMTPAWKGYDICMWVHATACLNWFSLDVNWCDCAYDGSTNLKKKKKRKRWLSGVLGFLTPPHKVLNWQYLNRYLFETVSQTCSFHSDRKTAKVFSLSFNWRKIFPSSHGLSQISGVQCGTCRLFC